MYRYLRSLLFMLEPETSHRLFIGTMRFLHRTMLDRLFGYEHNGIELSNAAGLDKNSEIPEALVNLGFDRAVVGTVTNLPYRGNPRPRIYRTGTSLINRMGFPNDGSSEIAKRLRQVRVPVTANIMSTPGIEAVKDISRTLADLDIDCIDRYEVNISCPNVECNYDLDRILDLTDATERDIYIKVSPDIEQVSDIIKKGKRHRVRGFTVSNSSKTLVGGLSGAPIYERSLETQKRFIESGLEIIACGGIDSKAKAEERVAHGAVGIQIYTPLIYNGPGLIRAINGR